MALAGERYKKRPMLSKEAISSSILCPFRSSIRFWMQPIALYGSIILNLVSSQMYFKFRLRLSFITKLVLMFSLSFSYSEKMVSRTCYWMSLNCWAMMVVILHKKGVTDWYSFR